MKYSILIFSLILSSSVFAQQRVIIDADTGNEVDDLFAVSRALIEPSWDIRGLNATQWQASDWATPQTMQDSYRLNTAIVAYLNKTDKILTFRGAEDKLYDWGDRAHPSMSAYQIIKEAHKMPKGEKLKIATLGALTNVASAILMDETIVPKIAIYWLGSDYDFSANIMVFKGFNSNMDLHAVDVLLNSTVEFHIFPGNVARANKFRYFETKNRIENKHPLLDFLIWRWDNHVESGRYERIIWDLVVIQAMIYPEKCEEVKVRTSIVNGNRDVWVYKSYDVAFFKEDFFKTMLDYATAHQEDLK